MVECDEGIVAGGDSIEPQSTLDLVEVGSWSPRRSGWSPPFIHPARVWPAETRWIRQQQGDVLRRMWSIT
jgi:hypothetical protein